MKRDTLYYIAGTLVECPECVNHARLPHTVRKEDLPLVIVCPACGRVDTWEDVMPVLPKLPPLETVSVYKLIPYDQYKADENSAQVSSGKEDACVPDTESSPLPADAVETVETQEQALTTPEGEPQEEQRFFGTLAAKLGGLVRSTFDHIEDLHLQIDKFKNSIGDYFESEWAYAKTFRDKWRRSALDDFLRTPWITIPVPCDDKLAGAYSRLVLTPIFYNPLFGLEIASGTGFNVEVINHYTRMNFPLERDFALSLGVPESLALEVKGKKIVGASLPFCWKNIPDIGEDKDSSSEVISVFMTGYRARIWLARHGVCPWESVKIRREELNYIELGDEVYDNKLYLTAWKKFIKHGRLGLFWNDQMNMRKFATVAGLMVKGVTSVFCPGHKERMAWDHCYMLMNHRRHYNELVYFKNGDPCVWQAVMRTRMVIVDMTNDGVELGVLERLFEFPGKVLVLCDNALLDYDREDIIAPLVHGLAGFELHQRPEREQWQHSNEHASLAVINALKKLQEKQ